MTPPRVDHQDRGPERPLAETVQRLQAEFGGALEPDAIGRVVRACHRDLSGAPAAALPELVERLARVDLAELTDDPSRYHRRPWA